MHDNAQLNQRSWELMSQTGQVFFASMVEHLATVLGLRIAFIVESMDIKGECFAPLASWGGQGFREDHTYNILGTPCEKPASGSNGIYPQDLADLFPQDTWLQQSGMQSYIAVPLLDEQANVFGYMGVMDDRAMKNPEAVIDLLESFAHRARAEIINKQLETKLQRALQKLGDSEQQFTTLFGNTTCGLLFADPETGRFIECNRRICEMLGYSMEELKQLSIPDIHRQEDLPRVRDEFNKLTRHEEGQVLDFLVKRKDGSLFDAKLSNFWMMYQGKQCLVGAFIDVTGNKKTEQDLRRLADHIQSARESERILIAREIHDEMAQSLTAQKIDLVRLKSRLPRDDNFLAELSEDILQSINQTISSVQRILTELRPALLDDLGLLAAIEWQADQFQRRTKMQCYLELPEEEPQLTNKERTALFRIMQESLLNVLRHAQATEMHLKLIIDGPWLFMTIADNGIGVSDLDLLGNQSFGLMGMRERAHIFGGEVMIEGEAGSGTTVSTKIPLKKQVN